MYKNQSVVKAHKINHFSYNVWRRSYLIKMSSIHHSSAKKIWNRSSKIPITFLKFEILIHTGRKLKTKIVNKWMVGYKVGEFTWNRKPALYKAKQLRKKTKK